MSGEKLSPAALIQAAQAADILVISYEQVTEQVFQKLAQLKLVGCTRSTPVNIHLPSATQRGIPVLHTPGRNTQTAAELTLGLMLSAAHHIAHSHHALRSGKYLGNNAQDFQGFDPGHDITWKLDREKSVQRFPGQRTLWTHPGYYRVGKDWRVGVAQMATHRFWYAGDCLFSCMTLQKKLLPPA